LADKNTRFALACFAFLGLAALVAFAQSANLVLLVETTAVSGDVATAQRFLDAYKKAAGVTPEYIEALSWIGRAQLMHHNYGEAEKNAGEVRNLALQQLTHRPLDAEPHLPTALGASIEVQAQADASEGRRDQAVVFLRDELKHWQTTSIGARIQKNLNLLTLEGKPAPALDAAEWIGTRKPQPLTAYRGHPVLLFLWAHWCSDCKAEIKIVEQLEAAYGPKGLVVVAPTQHYGYVAGGADAPRAVETKYIADVFNHYYAGLGAVDIPLSEANFLRYGVSTTPTLVLIDSKGIVRLYNPGGATYEALASKVASTLSAN
jgi:thiol-disulfide isomerase/thioredoxin